MVTLIKFQGHSSIRKIKLRTVFLWQVLVQPGSNFAWFWCVWMLLWIWGAQIQHTKKVLLLQNIDRTTILELPVEICARFLSFQANLCPSFWASVMKTTYWVYTLVRNWHHMLLQMSGDHPFAVPVQIYDLVVIPMFICTTSWKSGKYYSSW